MGSPAPEKAASPFHPVEDAVPAALAAHRAGELSLLPVLCDLEQNSNETKRRELSQCALCFQLVKKSKAGRREGALFVSSLLPLAIPFSNCNFKKCVCM